MTKLLDPSPEGFGWAAGIENAFIGQTERMGAAAAANHVGTVGYSTHFHLVSGESLV